jgi:hypothetical protein
MGSLALTRLLCPNSWSATAAEPFLVEGQMSCRIMVTMKYAIAKIKTTAYIRNAGRNPKGATALMSETYRKNIMIDANAAHAGHLPLSSSWSPRHCSRFRSRISSALVNPKVYGSPLAKVSVKLSSGSRSRSEHQRRPRRWSHRRETPA